jgi:predicted nucleic acid-binding Zn finger protein
MAECAMKFKDMKFDYNIESPESKRIEITTRDEVSLMNLVLSSNIIDNKMGRYVVVTMSGRLFQFKDEQLSIKALMKLRDEGETVRSYLIDGLSNYKMLGQSVSILDDDFCSIDTFVGEEIEGFNRSIIDTGAKECQFKNVLDTIHISPSIVVDINGVSTIRQRYYGKVYVTGLQFIQCYFTKSDFVNLIGQNFLRNKRMLIAYGQIDILD